MGKERKKVLGKNIPCLERVTWRKTNIITLYREVVGSRWRNWTDISNRKARPYGIFMIWIGDAYVEK